MLERVLESTVRSCVSSLWSARSTVSVGQLDDACRAYAFFLEHWSGADAHLQPWVEEARRRLAEKAAT